MAVLKWGGNGWARLAVAVLDSFAGVSKVGQAFGTPIKLLSWQTARQAGHCFSA
ncbi:hypothetical protein HY085_00985 [Candidatus Gottesmanbacteria bacterium]|nr:hypothetical protein [Candidatus Gottesmanbacteria bacterium]